MIDYEEEYKKQLEENMKNVIEEIDSPNMSKKINNYANKFGDTP